MQKREGRSAFFKVAYVGPGRTTDSHLSKLLTNWRRVFGAKVKLTSAAHDAVSMLQSRPVIIVITPLPCPGAADVIDHVLGPHTRTILGTIPALNPNTGDKYACTGRVSGLRHEQRLALTRRVT